MNRPAVESPWIDPPKARPRGHAVRVTATMLSGRRVQYDATVAHTFDAYDAAIERFGPDLCRIEVTRREEAPDAQA